MMLFLLFLGAFVVKFNDFLRTHQESVRAPGAGTDNGGYRTSQRLSAGT